MMNGVKYEKLSKTVDKSSNHEIEAYFMEIEAGKSSGSKEYGHPGKELGVVLQGTGELEIAGDKYIIEDGDSISFDSSSPHVFKNTGSGVLRAIWIVTPPKNL